MNTDRLARHYHSLSTWERLTMLHASEKRGDTFEQQTLIDSSPEIVQSDAGRLELSLMHLSTLHFAFQFATVCEFWHARCQLAREKTKCENPTTRAALFWTSTALLIQSHYNVERDGWKLFVKRSGLDESRITNDLLSDHHIFVLMDEDKNAMPNPQRDEAAANVLHEHFYPNTKRDAPRTVTTAEDVADRWEQTIEQLIAIHKRCLSEEVSQANV